MSNRLRVVTGAALVGGRWLQPGASLSALVREAEQPLDGSPAPLMEGKRLRRADDLTKLAARTVNGILEDIEQVAPDANSLGIIGASVLSSLRSNEQFERRRLQSGRAAPRVFPYTASNAWLGELSIALGARGPNLNLVGSSEVGLQALQHAARWMARGRCEHVLVVVAECPPDDRQILVPARWTPMDAAVALLVSSERAPSGVLVGLDRGQDHEDSPRESNCDATLLSVGPVARLLLAVWSGRGTVRVQTPTGASLVVSVGFSEESR